MKPRVRKADADLLQGTWSVVDLEIEGRKLPAAMLSAARIVLQGDRFQSLGMGAAYAGKLELDPTANPKAFDLVFTAGPEAGNRALGIYLLDGDTWKICLTTRGGERPAKFAAEPGTGYALEVLRRGWTEPASPGVEREAGAGPATELEGEWSMVSGFMDGHRLDRSMVKAGRRVTRGNRTSVSFGAQVFLEAAFTLDATQSPAWIDLAHKQGMHAGKTQLGIYACDGKTLKLSSAQPGDARPADFESRPGDGRTVVVWKRVSN